MILSSFAKCIKKRSTKKCTKTNKTICGKSTTRPLITVTAEGETRGTSTAMEPLPREAIDSLPYVDLPVKWPDVQRSKMSQHGMEVLSFDTPKPVSSMSLIVNVGPRFEQGNKSGKDLLGVSHFFRNFCYRNNLFKYSAEIIRNVDGLGADFSVDLSRERLAYHAQGMNVPEFVENIGETFRSVLAPTLDEWQVAEVKEHTKKEIANVSTDPYNVITQLMHSEAYRDTSLGLPIFCTEAGLSGVSAYELAHYHYEFIMPSNMILVGTGVRHSDLEKVSSKLFEYAEERNKDTGRAVPQPAKYVGGTVGFVLGEGPTHFSIAFEAPKGNADIKMRRNLLVLKALLGGYGVRPKESIPGSGVTSALTTQFGSKNNFVHRAAAFDLPYSDSGLFGVYVQMENGHSGNVRKELMKMFEDLAKKEIGKPELNKAINNARIQLLGHTQNLQALDEFIAEQAFASKSGDKVLTPNEFAESLKKVTSADIKSTVETLLKSKPTISIVGRASDRISI